MIKNIQEKCFYYIIEDNTHYSIFIINKLWSMIIAMDTNIQYQHSNFTKYFDFWNEKNKLQK